MRIAITGGSGFLGRAIIARLTNGGADRIVTFSRDEQKRAALQADFGWHPGFRVYAGDVRDRGRLGDILHGCEAVVHAAARKVVTGHPDEPEEMLKTNIVGTLNVIEAARSAGCHKLIVVSSDKAVHAENVYGVSKAMAEHLAIMSNARTFGAGLRVGVVRYGNVLGSTGSVVLRWRREAERGDPLTVTDPAMTRFWITVDQAVTLVLDALSGLRGGEIVVPHLPAADLRTLAEAIGGPGVALAPQQDVPMERGEGVWTMRQGGEKLHEMLLAPHELRRTLKRGDKYIVPPFQHAEMWDAKPWLGDPVPADFTYESGTWPHRIGASGLREMLGLAVEATV